VGRGGNGLVCLGDGCSNVALIRHTNVIDTNREEIRSILPKDCESRVFYYSFQKNVMEEAYAPFLSIIEDLASPLFIASCEVFFPRVSAISDKLKETKRGISYASRSVKRRAAFGN
jgi:hypothetical protein